MERTKKNSVIIKLIGGPLDGDFRSMDKPYNDLIGIPSEHRSDVIYIYVFDSNPANHTAPFAYKFSHYKKL